MGVFVNPDNGAFQVALDSKIYVDKTGLLKYVNSVLGTTNAYICNSRPRRFGKSITANMLTAYYSRGCDSTQMFAGLEISRDPNFEKYLNKYDVIHWDVQWCIEPAGGAEQVVSYLRNCGNIIRMPARNRRIHFRRYCRRSIIQPGRSLLSLLMSGMC